MNTDIVYITNAINTYMTHSIHAYITHSMYDEHMQIHTQRIKYIHKHTDGYTQIREHRSSQFLCSRERREIPGTTICETSTMYGGKYRNRANG